MRRLHGRESYTAPSRFLGEIPGELLSEVRAGSHVVNRIPTTATQPGGDTSIQLGGRVRHNSFGDGVVLSVEGRGEHTRVQVNFESVGNKWLVLAYANLETI